MVLPQVPTRFRCRVGGEWKSLSDFSNAQQRLIQHRNVDTANSGMTCREHTAGTRMELKCELCLLTKPIDEFSKNSRRKREYQCRRCVAWIEIQEPTLTPGPLETGHISPEEENQQMLRQRFRTSEDFADCDVDDENLLPRAPISGLASLGLDEEAVTKAIGKDAIDAFLNLPPHLRSKATSVASFSANVSETSSVQGNGVWLPPNLREKYNVMSSASSTTAEISIPTTLREANSDTASIPHRSYNAWGPDGDMQRRKVTSVTDDSISATASASAISQNADPNIVGDWSEMTGPRVIQPKGRPRWGKDVRLSTAELRETMGDVHQAYIHRETDFQKHKNPIRCDVDDDDSD